MWYYFSLSARYRGQSFDLKKVLGCAVRVLKDDNNLNCSPGSTRYRGHRSEDRNPNKYPLCTSSLCFSSPRFLTERPLSRHGNDGPTSELNIEFSTSPRVCGTRFIGPNRRDDSTKPRIRSTEGRDFFPFVNDKTSSIHDCREKLRSVNPSFRSSKSIVTDYGRFITVWFALYRLQNPEFWRSTEFSAWGNDYETYYSKGTETSPGYETVFWCFVGVFRSDTFFKFFCFPFNDTVVALYFIHGFSRTIRSKCIVFGKQTHVVRRVQIKMLGTSIRVIEFALFYSAVL